MSTLSAIYADYPINGSRIAILDADAAEHINPSRVAYIQEKMGEWHGAAVADIVQGLIDSRGSNVTAATLLEMTAQAKGALENMSDDPQDMYGGSNSTDAGSLRQFYEDVLGMLDEPAVYKRDYNLYVWY